MISHELHCVKCGYCLLGLPQDSRCPECGTPIAHSRRTEVFASFDVRWLREVAWGMRIVFWSQVLLLIAFGRMVQAGWLEPIGVTVLLGAHCLGAWMMAHPHTSYGGAEPPAWIRLPLRGIGFVMLLVAVFACLRAHEGRPAIVQVINILMLLMFPFWAMTFCWLERLATRMADSRQHAMARVGAVGSMILLIIAIYRVAQASPNAIFNVLSQVFVPFFSLILLVMLLVLLTWVSNDLSDAARGRWRIGQDRP